MIIWLILGILFAKSSKARNTLPVEGLVEGFLESFDDFGKVRVFFLKFLMMASALKIIFPNAYLFCHQIKEVLWTSFFSCLKFLPMLNKKLSIFPVFFHSPFFELFLVVFICSFSFPFDYNKLAILFVFFLLNFFVRVHFLKYLYQENKNGPLLGHFRLSPDKFTTKMNIFQLSNNAYCNNYD